MTDSSTSGVTLLSVLRLRDFRLFLTGRFLGTLGTQIQSVAVGWQVYEITRSPLALGFVGLAQFLPMVILLLPAGDIADRVDRRIVIAASYFLQAVSVALLIVLTWTGTGAHSIWPFYLVLAIFGTARAFSGPALRAFVPLLVSKEQLPRGIAISSSSFQIAVIVGPALGGFIYIWGPLAAYGTCLVFFLGVAVSFIAIRTHHKQQPIDPTLTAFGRLTAGIAYIRDKPIILGAISLDLFAVLLGGATALLPIYASDILHVGPQGLGVLRSAPAIGAVLINFLLIAMPLQRYTGLIMFACVAVFGVATVVFGLSENFLLSMAALLVMGASDMVSVYVRSTLIPLATPPEKLGRVSAVDLLFISASNELGEFESGVMAGWLGTVPSVVVGGLGTIGIVALWMWLFPALRKVDRLMDVKPDPS
ncbi:MAG: MFS transporter [Parvibaculum sp.]|uniref:MFS transporter n=1 Tax=Parvibaculum sp. TaxID=2024848 RepID=UPI0025CC4082|nr:MFS transporter [Parvibaculum sp.]MCE9648687.1 MFS transporter [Parvibaculum sp.]